MICRLHGHVDRTFAHVLQFEEFSFANLLQYPQNVVCHSSHRASFVGERPATRRSRLQKQCGFSIRCSYASFRLS